MAEYISRTVGTSAANTQFTFFQPTLSLVLETDDVIDVTAPAGGVGITSSIAIYMEEIG